MKTKKNITSFSHMLSVKNYLMVLKQQCSQNTVYNVH